MEPPDPKLEHAPRSPTITFMMGALATLADLPNEMMQEIMDHISPTDISIASLSLISPSWYLYLRNFNNQMDRFTCIYLHSRNIIRFLALLQSPLCSFRENVRQLFIDWDLGRNLRGVQGMIHSILVNTHTTHTNHPKSTLTSIKKSVAKFMMPSVKECHVLNIVCLFPCLEHLQVQLIGIESNIPHFPTQPSVSPTLKSISVICNSSPPRTSGRDAYVPPEWRRFLKWVHSNGIYTIRNLYLTLVAPWNYRAALMFVQLQGTSLKHLHLGPDNCE